MEMLSSKQKTVIIIAGVFVVGIFIFYMTTKAKTLDYSDINNVTYENIVDEEEKIKEEPKEIVVHITGAVKNEGIVKLQEGARTADAVEAAGGITDEASLESVNLAYLLKDGQKIYIPKISDIWGLESGNQDIPINTIIFDNDAEETNSKVNINTATINELTGISGVGEKTAMKIIEYREANGKFKTIEDIKEVSGIGEAKYESIKDYICVN